jgi:hypothetical protein
MQSIIHGKPATGDVVTLITPPPHAGNDALALWRAPACPGGGQPGEKPRPPDRSFPVAPLDPVRLAPLPGRPRHLQRAPFSSPAALSPV